MAGNTAAGEAPRAVIVDTSKSPHARLRPVPLDAVTLSDAFWQPRRETLKAVTLPSQYARCEKTGRIDNFRRVSGTVEKPFQGRFYNDSDVYKWLEAVSWMLAGGGDADSSLTEMADTVIDAIIGAQDTDGYINTYFSCERKGERWSNIKDMHEMYCGGHLIQAGVAHFRSTGSSRLLDVGRRFADHLIATWGPEEEKRHGACGHEEIELALVELSRATGDMRYLGQAQYFLDCRGRGLISGQDYHQDHRPFRDLDRIAGHAVRAAYQAIGATDLYAETGEQALRGALDRLWSNMTGRRMYITGGIGSRTTGEAFGTDYDLPNEQAYAETCAAIASGMWNWRMLLLEGEAKYADMMELSLYNGALVGLSLSGEEYFYENPLADDGSHRRTPWFSCACCPPNLARMLAEVPGQMYSLSDEGIWAHLYAESSTAVEWKGRDVRLVQKTAYPWEGDISFTLEGECQGEFSLYLRIPGWCESPSLCVNGSPVEGATPGTYADIRRQWSPGDTIRLSLPMPVRLMESHPYVAENTGRVALMRGPLVYCLESADNPGVDLRDIAIPADAAFAAEFEPALLGGVTALRCQAEAIAPGTEWEGALYRPFDEEGKHGTPTHITAVPYYAWANREPGRMAVWLLRG